MTKLLKTIVLIPAFPLIWITKWEERDGSESGCARRADAMLRWRRS